MSTFWNETRFSVFAWLGIGAVNALAAAIDATSRAETFIFRAWDPVSEQRQKIMMF
jgi:hypothetical protein